MWSATRYPSQDSQVEPVWVWLFLLHKILQNVPFFGVLDREATFVINFNFACYSLLD